MRLCVRTFLSSKRFNSAPPMRTCDDRNVLRMLWTQLLDNAVPSCAGKSEDALVWHPNGVGSSDRKMVLYLLLEL